MTLPPYGWICTQCKAVVPWATSHNCPEGNTQPNTYSPPETVEKRIERLLQRLVELAEQAAAVAPIESTRPEWPLTMHFKGRSMPLATVDDIRTQLDDYVTGKDTRPLVIGYDGEVKWVPGPEGS